MVIPLPWNERLKQERKQLDLTKNDLADMLGVDPKTVDRWEKGETKPYPCHQKRIAEIFGKSMDELGSFSSTYVFDPLLPIPLSGEKSLIGRDLLLAEIKVSLCAGESVALKGIPGVGKTALAVALACDPEIQSHFRDGILWAGLGINPNVLGSLSRWGARLNVLSTALEDTNNPDSWGKALRTIIDRRHMLLVIDDAWDAQEALAFQVGGLNCAHLLTTRKYDVAFHFAGKNIFEIPTLTAADGLSLLERFAPEAITQNTDAARELVNIVGALPLALTLIGKYLGAQTQSGQPRRIQMTMELLQAAEQRLHVSIPTSPMHRPPNLPSGKPLSLHASISVSYQHLSCMARDALQALSILPAQPNSFSEEAALAVAAVPIDVLDTICDSGLLEPCGQNRYMLHQTIADYAYSHLEGTTVHERLMDYAIEFLKRASTDEKALERESSTIIAALQAAFALNKRDYLVRSFSAIADFLQRRGVSMLADRHLLMRYELVTSLRYTLNNASPLLHLGTMLQKGEQGLALDAYLNEGLTLARQKGNLEQSYRLLISLGWIASVRGDYTQAEIYYKQALTLARQEQKKDQISALLAGLGWLAEKRQDYKQAEKYLQEEIKLAELEGSAKQLSVLYTSLGWIFSRQGNYAQAKLYGLKGLTLARKSAGNHNLCGVLLCLSTMAMSWGDYDLMEKCVKEALPLARREDCVDQLCLFLAGQGWIVDQLHDNVNQAREYYEEGLALARSRASQEILVWILTFHAWFAYKHKDWGTAEANAQEGLELAVQLGHQEMQFRMIILLGRLAELHKNYKQAYAYYKKGLTFLPYLLRYPTLEVSQFISRFLSWVGELQLKLQLINPAANSFEQLLKLASDGSTTDFLNTGKALYGLAHVEALRGDNCKARSFAEESLNYFERERSVRAQVVHSWLTKLKAQEDS